VQAGEGGGQPPVIAREPRKRAAQAKLRSTTHRRGSSTNPRFAPDSLTTDGATPCPFASAAGRAPV
jgi:hypothetical protein